MFEMTCLMVFVQEVVLKVDKKLTVLGDWEKQLLMKQEFTLGGIDEDLEVMY